MQLKIIPYSQRDNKWGNIVLGYNKDPKYNLSDYGCLIVSFASYLASLGQNETPATINQKFKDNAGFVKDSGLFIWTKSDVLDLKQTYLSPYYNGPVTDFGVQKAQELLNAGFPLITEVDFNPATTNEEMHFVLVCGYDGENFLCMDPWRGEIVSLDYYGGFKRGVIQFRVYDKTLSKTDSKPMISIESDIFENLVRKSSIYDEVYQKLNVADNKEIVLAEIDKLVSYEDMVVQKDKQISEAENKINNLEMEINELSKKYKTMEEKNTVVMQKVDEQSKMIDKYTEELKVAQNSLQELKTQLQKPPLTGWKLFIYKLLLGR